MSKIILIKNRLKALTVLLVLLNSNIRAQESRDWLYDFDYLVDSVIGQSYGLQPVVESLMGQ